MPAATPPVSHTVVAALWRVAERTAKGFLLEYIREQLPDVTDHLPWPSKKPQGGEAPPEVSSEHSKTSPEVPKLLPVAVKDGELAEGCTAEAADAGISPILIKVLAALLTVAGTFALYRFLTGRRRQRRPGAGGGGGGGGGGGDRSGPPPLSTDAPPSGPEEDPEGGNGRGQPPIDAAPRGAPERRSSAVINDAEPSTKRGRAKLASPMRRFSQGAAWALGTLRDRGHDDKRSFPEHPGKKRKSGAATAAVTGAGAGTAATRRATLSSASTLGNVLTAWAVRGRERPGVAILAPRLVRSEEVHASDRDTPSSKRQK